MYAATTRAALTITKQAATVAVRTTVVQAEGRRVTDTPPLAAFLHLLLQTQSLVGNGTGIRMGVQWRQLCMREHDTSVL
jgi:hypothetical protein